MKLNWNLNIEEEENTPKDVGYREDSLKRKIERNTLTDDVMSIIVLWVILFGGVLFCVMYLLFNLRF
jgi:hypothetical protein